MSTQKISTQKAVSLAKKVGSSVKEMDNGAELAVAGGVLLKESNEYYLTTVSELEAPTASELEPAKAVGNAEATETKPEPAGGASFIFEPKRDKHEGEAPLYGRTRRQRSRKWKAIMRRKRAGMVLSARELELLSLNATACRKAAEIAA